MRTRLFIAGFAMTAVALSGCTLMSSGSGGTLEGVTWTLTSYFADGSTNGVAENAGIDATFQATNSVVSGSAGVQSLLRAVRGVGVAADLRGARDHPDGL